jgi:hypothetical protein
MLSVKWYFNLQRKAFKLNHNGGTPPTPDFDDDFEENFDNFDFEDTDNKPKDNDKVRL